MSKLIVYFGDNPQCVEGFSESCKRSNEGALHLLPGKQKTITDDEYKFILENCKKLKIRMIADKPDEVLAKPAKEKLDVLSDLKIDSKIQEKPVNLSGDADKKKK